MSFSLSLNTLIQVYRSLIFPYTHYGIAAWGQAAHVYLRKVFIVKKRALRLTFFAGNRSHAIPFFVSDNVTTYLPILRVRISVIFLLIHLTFIHMTLDFLMLVIYILINQDWEFNLIRFPFSELSCGITRSLTCVNLGNNLSKIKFINFYLRYLVMTMIMLMSLR